MSMDDYRRLAAKMDQHMQQLAAQGVNAAPLIIDRMMGYVPDLQKIWVGTSDDQLIALSKEFPGFYRYAVTMEEGFAAEQKKACRPYDGAQEFSEPYKKMMATIWTDAATLERGYQAFLGSGNLNVFKPQVRELDQLHSKWLADMASFMALLKSDPTAENALPFVETGFNRTVERVADLARRASD